jgi:hypothetical protein
MELSKKDKKAAREVIEKGLQREFETGLSKTEKLLLNWRKGIKNNTETYHAVYKHIKNFDKHIAFRYDGITGSRYLITITGQLLDDVLHEEDLADFSEEVQLYLKSVVENYS